MEQEDDNNTKQDQSSTGMPPLTGYVKKIQPQSSTVDPSPANRSSLAESSFPVVHENDNNDGIGDFNLFNRRFDPIPTLHPPSVPLFNEPEDQPPQPSDDSPRQTKEERKRKRYYETQDLVSALEHIITIGAYNRHQQWRRDMWEKQQQEEATQPKPAVAAAAAAAAGPKEDDDDSDQEKDSKSQQRKEIHFLHAEDVRIYGLVEGFPADPWPLPPGKKRKRFLVPNDIDAPWDLEYGDQINPIDFSRDVLSNIAPTNTEAEENDHPLSHSLEVEQLLDPTRMDQMDPDRIKVTPNPKDVPRALLLRCWQRAVHAASFSTLQQPEQPNQTFSDLKDATYFQQIQKPASQRCVDLTVDMFPWATPSNPPFVCRLCGSSFETLPELKHHFHGSEQVRGCAWSEIHTQQRALIAKALLGEVESQADALVQFIMGKARDRRNADQGTAATNNNKTPTKLFNWKDILDMMKEALFASEEYDDESDAEGEMPALRTGGRPAAGPAREVTKTLQVREDLPPLVFNHQVLEAVSQRLIARYAPLPL